MDFVYSLFHYYHKTTPRPRRLPEIMLEDASVALARVRNKWAIYVIFKLSRGPITSRRLGPAKRVLSLVTKCYFPFEMAIIAMSGSDLDLGGATSSLGPSMC